MPRAGLSYRGKAPSSYNLSVSLRSTRPGCGSQRLLRCRSHPAGRCPNSSSLFPPLAAVVAVAPGRGASGETVHFAGTAKASPTRGGGSASALTERLYKDGPALGSSLVNLPPRLSPQNAKPPRSCDLPGGFFLRELPQSLREWPLQLRRGRVIMEVSKTPKKKEESP